jgi:uncharacterized protein YndB with AHSA1/START domain
MNAARPDFGTLLDAQTLTIRRRLPGPIERVWAYLTDGELRRRWLAAGDMPLHPGAAFELVWRNDELGDPPGQRPAGFGEEHRMRSHIVAVEVPHRLVFTWGEKETGEVTFDLMPDGDEVLLTVTHRRIPDRAIVLKVGAGWHAHLDILVARLSDGAAPPFWDHWRALHDAYAERVPA